MSSLTYGKSKVLAPGTADGVRTRYRGINTDAQTPGRDPRLVPPGIGHNGGPPLERTHGWTVTCWRKAQKKAWKTPPIEVVRRRCKRAAELGMTYREYTLEILERGRNL